MISLSITIFLNPIVLLNIALLFCYSFYSYFCNPLYLLELLFLIHFEHFCYLAPALLILLSTLVNPIDISSILLSTLVYSIDISSLPFIDYIYLSYLLYIALYRYLSYFTICHNYRYIYILLSITLYSQFYYIYSILLFIALYSVFYSLPYIDIYSINSPDGSIYLQILSHILLTDKLLKIPSSGKLTKIGFLLFYFVIGDLPFPMLIKLYLHKL